MREFIRRMPKAELHIHIQQALGLDKDDVLQLVKNSFQASFLAPTEKQKLLQELDTYARTTQAN